MLSSSCRVHEGRRVSKREPGPLSWPFFRGGRASQVRATSRHCSVMPNSAVSIVLTPRPPDSSDTGRIHKEPGVKNDPLVRHLALSLLSLAAMSCSDPGGASSRGGSGGTVGAGGAGIGGL